MRTDVEELNVESSNEDVDVVFGHREASDEGELSFCYRFEGEEGGEQKSRRTRPADILARGLVLGQQAAIVLSIVLLYLEIDREKRCAFLYGRRAMDGRPTPTPF